MPVGLAQNSSQLDKNIENYKIGAENFLNFYIKIVGYEKEGCWLTAEVVQV